MKIKKTSGDKKPTANLAINKSRIKKYGKSKTIPSYYLEKGQEFQIELFNPTQGKILTTIKLNNKPISGGLVIRPGERVFLDRFLDTNKKFLFDTYNVDNTKSAKKAIEPNGDVEIAFFKEVEEIPFFQHFGSSGTVTLDCFDSDQFGTTNVGFVDSSSGTYTLGNSTLTTSTGGYNQLNINEDIFIPVRGESNAASLTIDGDVNIKGDLSVDGNIATRGITLTNEKDQSLKSKNLKGKRRRTTTASNATPTTIETGRVEKGSNSKQDLREASGDFEMMSFHIIKYKLSPKSQKQLTSVDYYTKHCTNCGGRCKTKFCAFCGKQQ